MLSAFDTQWLGYGAVALIVAGIAGGLLAGLLDPSSAIRGALHHYERALDRDLARLHASTSGRQVAGAQAVVSGVLVCGAVAYGVEAFAWVGLAGAVAVQPLVRWRVRKRVRRIEAQLDSWLLLLANMLRATSSVVDAVRATASLVRAPLSQEIELVLKEVRCGASVDTALHKMDDRIGSRMLSTVITAITVGQKSGGNLPALLDKTAASLRELMRLEGVVKSMTSQAKTQVIVLAAIPPLIYVGFSKADPEYFEPVLHNSTGQIALVLSGLLWVCGIMSARRILRVDI